MIGGDFNGPLNNWDKRGGRPVEHKKTIIQEMNNLMKTYDLADRWQVKNPIAQGYTWNNPSMKIQCRLYYFFLSKDIRSSLKAIKIVPNVFSDHSALSLVLTHCEKEANRGVCFRKFNNSLLIDEEARSCESLLTIKKCSEALNKFQNRKTPGSDFEFYRCFWNAVASFMIDSFNYSFENGLLAISQRDSKYLIDTKERQTLAISKKLEASLPS